MKSFLYLDQDSIRISAKFLAILMKNLNPKTDN